MQQGASEASPLACTIHVGIYADLQTAYIQGPQCILKCIHVYCGLTKEGLWTVHLNIWLKQGGGQTFEISALHSAHIVYDTVG